MIDVLIVIIDSAEKVLFFLVLAKVLLSYVMDPYHPVRLNLDKLLEPLLAPIRRVVPQIGMFDFSPLVLIILVQLIASLLIGILRTMR